MAFSLFGCLPCVAQATANDLSGTGASPSAAVTDSQGMALPDAPLKPANAAVQASRTAPNNDVFPTFKARERAYLTDLVGPRAFLSAAIQAASDQGQTLQVGYPPDGYPGAGKHPAHGVVPEWGQGFDGYTKRYASRFGMGLVSTTTQYGLGEILRQDISYHPCQCVGVFPRAYHAISQSLVAHTRSGKSIPSVPALASPFVAAAVATAAWYPARYNASDALRTSTSLYYGLAIKNLINEFRRR